MRTKLLALALAAMLAIGTGGVVAAGTSSGTAAVQLPDDHTVTVTDPFDRVSSADVDEVIEAAWSSERVQHMVSDLDGAHFHVVAGTEAVEVQISAGPDAPEEVVAELDAAGTVTEVFTPTHTRAAAMSYSLTEPDDDADTFVVTRDSTSYDEKLTADQSVTIGVAPENITLVADGEAVPWLGADHAQSFGINLIEEALGSDQELFTGSIAG